MLYRTTLFLLLINFLAPLKAKAQQKTIQDSLYSEVLKENRKIHVVLPEGYDPQKGDEYQIVYCLDDISNFLTLELNFLQGEGFVPKNMIMVGITNPKPNGVDMRDRDFTPTKLWEPAGGADTFLQFLRTELLPFVKKKYQGALTGNVLYGGSLGGLFVMYNFLSDPGLFTSYIAIDPSLWWDNRLISKIADQKFGSLKGISNTLFIAGREGNAYGEMGIAAMDSVLRAKAPEGLNWKIAKYKNETHYSTNFVGFWEGMKFSYGGFYASTGGYNTSRRIVIKPKTGIVLKDQPFRFISYNLLPNEYIHYTTDGNKPDLKSPKLAGEETLIKLDKSSKIIVKSIGVRSEYNRLDSAFFEVGETFKSIPLSNGFTSGGLQYKWYEGNWSSIPDVRKLKPLRTGLADDKLDINQQSSAGKDILCIQEGLLKIDRKGYYIIEMGGGNQDSRVYLNNKQILGKSFIKDEGEMYLAPLEAGYYPLRIEFFKKSGNPGLSPIYIKPEGIEDFAIPLDMLFSKRD